MKRAGYQAVNKMEKIQKIKLPWYKNIFTISLLLKGINGLMEIIGSLLIIFIGPDKAQKLVGLITFHELNEDPLDFFANKFLNLAQAYTADLQIFGFLYLFSHGLIKIFLIIALLKRKMWAYPLAIIIFIAFVGYQIYRYTFTNSLGLILLSIFDIIVIVLTIREYRKIKIKNVI